MSNDGHTNSSASNQDQQADQSTTVPLEQLWTRLADLQRQRIIQRLTLMIAQQLAQAVSGEADHE